MSLRLSRNMKALAGTQTFSITGTGERDTHTDRVPSCKLVAASIALNRCTSIAVAGAAVEGDDSVSLDKHSQGDSDEEWREEFCLHDSKSIYLNWGFFEALCALL